MCLKHPLLPWILMPLVQAGCPAPARPSRHAALVQPIQGKPGGPRAACLPQPAGCWRSERLARQPAVPSDLSREPLGAGCTPGACPRQSASPMQALRAASKVLQPAASAASQLPAASSLCCHSTACCSCLPILQGMNAAGFVLCACLLPRLPTLPLLSAHRWRHVMTWC